jgi:glycosyltransferase involved in cell wall biosynthesis
MKFPFILFFRLDKYKKIDDFFTKNAAALQCSVYITNKFEKVKKLYDSNYHLLITYGPSEKEYEEGLLQIISETMLENRRFHLTEITDINAFNEYINVNYITNCSINREYLRPTFSLFTPSFNSYHKIMRVYESLKAQTLKDWEWVIIDDSPDDEHFQFLRKQFSQDSRIRFYRRSQNNGSIGNVKNETIGLCRGKYLLEMDHDDELLPSVLQDATDLFKSRSDVGFIYMDCACIYESGENQWYGDFICKGYGGYYASKHNDKWRLVYITPNINNITLTHLVCCPNHPRIWRREFLLELGNYCEYLHICDDYEILLRTAISPSYKMAKIHKLGYIQYMNEGESNFSLIRNGEINRIGPHYISPIYYDVFKINEKMKVLDAHEDESYSMNNSKIWTRDTETYTHKYCNVLVNPDYDTQICIICFDNLINNLDRIREMYETKKYDFILLDNDCTTDYLCSRLDYLKLDRMKCYGLVGASREELVNYFKMLYSSTEKYEMIDNVNMERPKYNTPFNDRHSVINKLTRATDSYLEIGVEYGYTFNHVHFSNKTGVDPDPKCSNQEIVKCTSDEFFEKYPEKTFDVIFIDGMHNAINVLQDFKNSIKVLNENGSIFIDDIIPLNYNEQLTIPLRHYYENGILKYGEEWTGDVWKVIYYLLVHYKTELEFSYFCNISYRGVGQIKIKDKASFKLLEDEAILEEINKYDYFKDFNHYLDLCKIY